MPILMSFLLQVLLLFLSLVLSLALSFVRHECMGINNYFLIESGGNTKLILKNIKLI